ncbi:hypothetical protein EVAR_55900_1 [Eumeta japonica]|uniref:Reverse transcriptase domain-containing protein n=1 Tax=Eumeta variegata TaxID=151549 RepID=A0A4C1YLP1_EUMVA|nr:hypothetical protein EVAR_55900_1 [Eumeta japonica]
MYCSKQLLKNNLGIPIKHYMNAGDVKEGRFRAVQRQRQYTCGRGDRDFASVRQRCMSPQWSFNTCMDICLYDLKEYEYGLRMDKLFVKCFVYADHKVILELSACELQAMVMKMNDSVKKRGMKQHYSFTVASDRGRLRPVRRTNNLICLVDVSGSSRRDHGESIPPMRDLTEPPIL